MLGYLAQHRQLTVDNAPATDDQSALVESAKTPSLAASDDGRG